MNRPPSGRFLEVAIAIALTLAALVVLMVRLSSAAEPRNAAISVSGAWARATVAKVANSAIYFRIDNHGERADTLLSARSEVSRAVELHQTRVTNGVVGMRHVKEGVPVPARSSVTFAPGGYHVMLVGVKAPLEKGRTFPLTLKFAKAGEIAVSVTVGEAGPPGEQQHHRGRQ